MDTNVLAGGGVGASVIIVLGLVYKLVNHKKLVSKCCGHSVDMSLDIGDTTPPEVRIRVSELKVAYNLPKVAYDLPKVAYDLPKVAYDLPKVAYDLPKVAYDLPKTPKATSPA